MMQENIQNFGGNRGRILSDCNKDMQRQCHEKEAKLRPEQMCSDILPNL